jgi:hypothetical protein
MPTYDVDYESPEEGVVHTYTAEQPPEKGEIVTLDGSDSTVVVDDVAQAPDGQVRIHVSRAPG